jgi:predicted metal-dependent phosphoesterase TrpH
MAAGDVLPVGRADLHSHTNLSDGLLSPDELIREACRAGVEVLSITDHDTLDAYAHLPAGDLGVELVMGLELSAFHDGSETHILGYFVDPKAPALVSLIERSVEGRLSRARRILERLEAAGVRIPDDKKHDLFANNRVGRPHIARAMVDAGVVASVKDAFKKWLTPGMPGYERRPDLPDGKETVRAIVAAGGAAVLAHPGNDCLADPRPVDELIGAGLAGLEVYHPRHTRSETESLARFASGRGLVATGGSDYHGEGREGARLGDRCVGTDVVDVLRRRAGVGR